MEQIITRYCANIPLQPQMPIPGVVDTATACRSAIAAFIASKSASEMTLDDIIYSCRRLTKTKKFCTISAVAATKSKQQSMMFDYQQMFVAAAINDELRKYIACNLLNIKE